MTYNKIKAMLNMNKKIILLKNFKFLKENYKEKFLIFPASENVIRLKTKAKKNVLSNECELHETPY